ncbi:PREDICTED: zinc finger protein 271-like [Galeopterus variegatus]|uniref:Zinc finger protein 271-like n=1 Tax=Galeopterus variegatus TaxID=482537 RepID=A0ABM0RPY6_GALVR|nr:PREDICTED: zinc finger protein 271-like [Galeopterus variegatus]
MPAGGSAVRAQWGPAPEAGDTSGAGLCEHRLPQRRHSRSEGGRAAGFLRAVCPAAGTRARVLCLSVADRCEAEACGTGWGEVKIEDGVFLSRLNREDFAFLSRRWFPRSSNPSKQRIHTGERTDKCKVCGKGFSRSDTGGRVWGGGFRESSNFCLHQRIHNGEKTYKCDGCRRAYTVSSNLILHYRVHTAHRPNGCDQCSNSFSWRSDLSKNQRLHTGENPPECNVYNKAFSQSSDLKHQRIHTEEKLYKCLMCGKAFGQSLLLFKHHRVDTERIPTI